MKRSLLLKVCLLLVVITLIPFLYKGIQYYLQNKKYAHYVVKSWLSSVSGQIENGYTDRTSYAPGELQTVFISGENSGKRWLKLYDIRGTAVDSVLAPVFEQEPQDDPVVRGFGYSPTFQYKLPRLKSGLYLWENIIPFIVKGSREKIVVLYPSNTINAYNTVGGKSFYSMFTEQSPVISFLRPTFPAVSFQVKAGLDFFWQEVQEPIRYISDQDMEDYASLEGADLLIIIGHSEYWTRQARLHFDRFVDEGGHAMILSGNTMWWQARYDKEDHRLICYKYEDDTVQNLDYLTFHWPDDRLNYPVIPSIGVNFLLGGFGRRYEKSFGGLKVLDPASALLAGTGLKKGDVIHVPTKEYDGTLVKLSADGEPVLEKEALPFLEAELIAYDRAFDDDAGMGTFLIFRRNASSGIVINTATMDWCSGYGMGGEDSLIIKKITHNMMDYLLKRERDR